MVIAILRPLISKWRPLGRASFLFSLTLAACGETEQLQQEILRPVRVVTVAELASGESISLSGVIRAEKEVDLAFRIGGRLLERLPNVGDQVQTGQAVARLDPEDETNAFKTAQSNLVAAEAQLIEAESNYERQAKLLKDGWTTRQRYDNVRQVLQTARSQVDSARAQLEIARRRLDDTELVADVSGAVVRVGAEPGEVVAAGQRILRIAREDGRDAVFDVPADMLARVPRIATIEVGLTTQPNATARGRVREVSPQADPETGTFRVRVGLEDPPTEMRLGSIVTGRTVIPRRGGVVIPSSALTRTQGKPAVWVVDPAASTVSSRPVEIMQHQQSEVVVEAGLTSGDVVVTAGVQSLRPGQRVRLLGEAS